MGLGQCKRQTAYHELEMRTECKQCRLGVKC